MLYTVNVFITFTLSLLGLTSYWWKQRHDLESLAPVPAVRHSRW